MFFPRCSGFLNIASFNVCVQQRRDFAARRGKRIKAALDARKRSRAKALEAAAAGPQIKKWMPKYMMIDKSTLRVGPRRYKPENLFPLPPDNVFFTKNYPRIGYSIEDIIDMHRETHHPTVWDEPEALLTAKIELDIRLKKKNKFLDAFEGIIDYKNRFDFQRQRRLLVVAKKREDQDKAMAAGAYQAGHLDVIKLIEKGELKPEDDFDQLLCQSDSLLDLAPARGMLRKLFPSKQRGNFGPDIVALVQKFMYGFDFKLERDDYEPDFGWVELPFARLHMDKKLVVENLTQLLNEIEKYKSPGHPGKYYHQVVIRCEPSKEKFRCKHWDLLKAGDYEDPYAGLFIKKGDDEASQDKEEAAN